ncbi:MAG: transketolase family protein [Bacillota bacterium]|nr:transketolase family protein [Bacillota bacterium]
MVTLSKTHEKDALEMRKVYCQSLMELAKENKDIVVLDADLSSSLGMNDFFKSFPDRAYNVGVAEANLAGVAAGLSAAGKIPYAHSFAPFATRRCYDQIFVSCAYAQLNVRIIGSDPGVTAAFNGGTHMPFEDVGIMRNIPDMTILVPTDAAMLKDLLAQTSKLNGMFYIRLLRKNGVKFYEDGSQFEIGKGVILREGKDATIVACGIMVAEAMKAAELLEEKGISVRVVDMFTIKPIDKDLIIDSAKQTGMIFTAENHNIINGLGSAVAEVLAENHPCRMKRIGVKDKFGQVGSLDYLKEVYELRAEDIVKTVLENL